MREIVMEDDVRDFQREKVYAWEREYLKNSGEHVPFDQIQSVINRVWKSEGLSYPPRLKKLSKSVTTIEGCADRLEVCFHDRGTSFVVILHELAHSMTAVFDGPTHQHNEVFVGVYMKLLEKHLGYNQFMLWWSADKAGVKFDRNAVPVITDNKGYYG